MTIVFVQGTTSEKYVDGTKQTVKPFVGADRGGWYSQVGIGYYIDGQPDGAFWGLLHPCNLVQSWRAMKIFELLPRVERSTLCACWYAASSRLQPADERYIQDLEAMFANPSTFRIQRKVILDSTPTLDELEIMLYAVKDHEIEDVNYGELTTLVEDGTIPDLPILGELIQRDRELQAREDQHRAFVVKAVPTEHSLGSLFAELGIDNLLDGPPIGSYGFDWGHIELRELDRYIKQYSTGRCTGSVFDLLRTTISPHSSSASLSKTVKPCYAGPDGALYECSSAFWSDGQIFVATTITVDNADIERVLSVSELREMMKAKNKRRRSRRS